MHRKVVRDEGTYPDLQLDVGMIGPLHILANPSTYIRIMMTYCVHYHLGPSVPLCINWNFWITIRKTLLYHTCVVWIVLLRGLLIYTNELWSSGTVIPIRSHFGSTPGWINMNFWYIRTECSHSKSYYVIGLYMNSDLLRPSPYSESYLQLYRRHTICQGKPSFTGIFPHRVKLIYFYPWSTGICSHPGRLYFISLYFISLLLVYWDLFPSGCVLYYMVTLVYWDTFPSSETSIYWDRFSFEVRNNYDMFIVIFHIMM